MLSMCGMLCRFLRGWRQSEAVEHMAHVAATLKDSSLIIEIVDLDSKTSKYESSPENSESWGHSSFCQPFCGQRSSVRQEQLWRDNNKQATIVSPKERVDLIHWTQFTSSLPSKGKNLPRDIQPHYSASAPTSTNHSPMTSRRNSACSECDNVITVLFEASYKEKGERLISHCNVMVEHFSEPLAWKMRDAFGIIVYTTPAMLVSLIHAFFNNSLVIDDDLTVDKILTVDLVGEPFTTCDPSTISSSVTPGPWSSSDLYSHLDASEPTGGVTLSNPNLSKEHSTLKRGLSLSSSFSSSPLKKLSSGGSSSFQVFSPVKRIFHWSGKSVTSSDNDSCPASPLVEEKEENECAKVAIARGKPPNLLIYAASNHQYFDDVKKTLEMCLEKDRYVIYHLTNEMAFKSPWVSNTALLVVCGDVPTHLSTVFIRYLLDGGNVLSICSDFMNVAVPLYAFQLPWTSHLVESGSVEVQEADVVSLSYRKWKNVKLLHHQHCSHSSPKHQRASTHTQKKSNSGSAVSVEPTSVEITDEHGVLHLLQLDVLARDDTWGAPSLLVARLNDGRGKAIFSQVHLEKNSEESISVKLKRGQLKASDVARIEILKDLLERHLGLYIKKREQSQLTYTHGFILGEHELKQKLLNDVKPFLNDSQLARRALILEFQDYNSQSSKPSDNLLPILMTGCPPNFSTVKYFEELKTVSIGRLVIYSEVLTSTMNVISGSPPLGHGVVVIATQQTSGKGRHGNVWLSPHGCLMISVQLQFSMTSHIGQRLPLLQHLISLATVLGVKTLSGYESLPLFLKWPNDIYVGSKTKIGGVLVDAASQKGTMVVNAGLGLNLANELPTISVNSVIREWNEANGAELAPLNREIICANIFNQLEKLLDEVQQNGSEKVIMEYYNHWLHGDAHVSVQNELGHKNVATIVGIDNYGFLMAHLESGEMIILHPDGNSFNMMEGLIYTKIPKI